MSIRVIQNKIKSSSKEYVRKALEILTNEKHFPKIISQYGFLFTKLPRSFVVCYISTCSFKLKRYLTSLDKISNLT